MKEKDRVFLLDAPLEPSGLFGDSQLCRQQVPGGSQAGGSVPAVPASPYSKFRSRVLAPRGPRPQEGSPYREERVAPHYTEVSLLSLPVLQGTAASSELTSQISPPEDVAEPGCSPPPLWVSRTVSSAVSCRSAVTGLRASSAVNIRGQPRVAEVETLLRKKAIEVVPPHHRESGFYSRYFIVPKKDFPEGKPAPHDQGHAPRSTCLRHVEEAVVLKSRPGIGSSLPPRLSSDRCIPHRMGAVMSGHSARGLSRQGPRPGEWMLHPEVVKQIWEIFVYPAPLGLDAMVQTWLRRRLYAFPPIALLPGVLDRVRRDGVSVLLVAPYWPGRVWFLDLISLLDGSSWEIPVRRDLLSQAQGTILHPRPELWKLWVRGHSS
ncbi:DNA polymerase III subunit alpha [Labeo rohita]|uniref:DNA polymerase III subunit alpha n=1 Tax=Labeo rohita TaxID=84645 RepID=A0ABQ8L7E3_LABRO|nr:DNA polymerase III subunit alpha [Labeo rohita]